MESDAWDGVFRSLYPRLFRSLIAIGAKPEEAEDSLQDAFLQALRQRNQVERPEAWLFVVAMRSWRRRRIRNAIFRPLSLLDGYHAEPPDGQRVTVLSELAQLPLRQRQVIIARYYLGLTQEETAELLGLARGTVAATATQARTRLRRRTDE
jgi:RNA polymerase sigma factor (sigma-70 family)